MSPRFAAGTLVEYAGARWHVERALGAEAILLRSDTGAEVSADPLKIRLPEITEPIGPSPFWQRRVPMAGPRPWGGLRRRVRPVFRQPIGIAPDFPIALALPAAPSGHFPPRIACFESARAGRIVATGDLRRVALENGDFEASRGREKGHRAADSRQQAR
jgi:hypothetical protein